MEKHVANDMISAEKHLICIGRHLNITKFIQRERIAVLDEDNSHDALEHMVRISKDCINNSSNFLDALIKREELMSTGFGFGIAYPHAKTSDVEDFFITIGVSRAGIDWKSFDAQPARLIFMIGGPDGQQEIYLKLLAALSTFLKNSGLHSQVEHFCSDPDALYEFVTENLT